MKSLKYIIFFALIAGTAAAQGERRTGFTLGLGAAVSTDPFVDGDVTALPFPLIRYQGERFSLGVDGLTYDVIQNRPFTVSLLATPRISEIAFSDNDALDGIDRDITADIGAAVAYDTGRYFATARVLQEVTGEHDGQEVIVEAGTRLPLGPVPVSFSAGFNWQSEDLAGYLWGVEPGEAVAGRPAYEPGDALIPFLSVGAVYPLTDRASIIGNARAEFLPDAVTDSPIVEDDMRLSAFIGFGYSF
ncbi:MAG: MipA/OmpV family protein [Pseudomonadota bacterium]